ncbi:YqzL family protein [Paenibacillus marinisediminis]
MRDFSWNVFANTGDVDAYLLYKHIGQLRDVQNENEMEQAEPPEQALE